MLYSQDHEEEEFNHELDKAGHTSWRFNSKHTSNINSEVALASSGGPGKDIVMAEEVSAARKRLAADSNTDLQGKDTAVEAMVVYENQSFVRSDTEPTEFSLEKGLASQLTPQKNLNKK